MKKVLFATTALFAGFAQAHPGIHHLNGVGHSVTGSDEWLTVAAVALWAVLQTALVVGLLVKNKQRR